MSLANPRKRWLYVGLALTILAMLLFMYHIGSHVPRLPPERLRAAREAMIVYHMEILNRYDFLIAKVHHLVEEDGHTLNEAMAKVFYDTEATRSSAEKAGHIRRGKSGRYVLLNGDDNLCVFRRLEDGSIAYVTEDGDGGNEHPKAAAEKGEGQ